MKKSHTIYLLLAALLLAAGCAGKPSASQAVTPTPQASEAAIAPAPAASAPAETPAAAQPIKVMASFYLMADFAQKIGGEYVTVTNMVPPGLEPHDWEPSAADITSLERADVLVYNGADMEHWVDKVLSTLENKDLIQVKTSEGIELLEGHSHSHDDEDDHDHDEDDHDEDDHDEDDHDEEEGGHAHDPHVWLNPLNVKTQLSNIKQAFAKVDPDHADVYEQNYQHWAAELDALDKEYRETITSLPRKEIIVAHQAFGYLCQAYGLTQVPIEGVYADSEPDPARMAEILRFAKEHDVQVIFFEQTASDKVAKTIADQLGVRTDVLTPIESLSDQQVADGMDYISVMRQNLKALSGALAQ